MAGTARGELGTAKWVRRTGGRLDRLEHRALLPPLLRSHLANVTGRTRLAVRLHPGRRSSLDGDLLQMPDSRLVRDATQAATDLLSPALLHHSARSFAWGAALGTLEGVAFDRELLCVAALLHDTGLPTPVAGVDFTARSAEVAAPLTRDLDDARREVVADAICMHHTPGVTPTHGPEAYLLSSGAAVDVFGMRSWDLPDAVRAQVVQAWPRLGFKREFARLFATEAKLVPDGRAAFLHRYAVSGLTIRLAPFRG